MLKSIIAAAFMTTAFTIVTVSAVSVTGEQALAAITKPVEAERASKLYELCLLSEGDEPGPDEDTPGDTLTLKCCTTNSEGVKWCVACNGGTKEHPTDCVVVSYPEERLPGRLKPKPGQGQLAPTKDKPKSRIPTKVWKFQKAPVANAPTKDKPKKTRPSTTGTMMNTVPMKQYKMAPTKQK